MPSVDRHPAHAFGFTVHPGTIENYVALARSAASERRPVTVLYHNLHSLYLWFRSPTLRQHYAGCTVLVDGMPLIALLRAAGVDVDRSHRVTYVDLIEPLMRMARDEGLRVFHVGQSSEIQATALTTLRERLPGLQIDGHDGYFDQSAASADSQRVVDAINAFGSDLVLIGFGTPRQEAWLHAHREAIEAPAVYACGACMEYVAGAVRTPPRWMGRFGLEWAFRLGEHPRRFAYRYLVEPVILAGHLLREWSAGRRSLPKPASAARR